MNESAVGLTLTEEKILRKQLRKRANSACDSQAKAYMTCINSTFFLWNCAPTLKEFSICFEKYASEEILFQNRLALVKKKNAALE